MTGTILRLALPAAALFFAAPAAAQSSCDGYTVRPGDTLYSIARRCGTSVAAIARANNIADPTRIEVGWRLRMPGQAEPPRYYEPPRAPEPPVRYEPPARYEPPRYPQPDYDDAQRRHGSYRVQPGDTLLSIARRFGISAAELMAANPRVYPYDLRPGTLLTLPVRRPAPPPWEDRYPDDRWDEDDRDYGDDGWRDDYREPWPEDPRYPGRPGPVYPQPPRYPVPGWPGGPGGGRDEIVVTGVVTGEGVECTALRGFDGRLYTLAGRNDRLRDGDVVTVRGRRAQVSFCQQGTTIEVRSIERERR